MRRVELSGGAVIIREPGDPAEVDVGGQGLESIHAQAGDAEWAAGKHAQQDADAEDAIVQSIVADLQGVKADIKAAPSGPLTLTRAQLLKIVRAVLWHIKGDKTA